MKRFGKYGPFEISSEGDEILCNGVNVPIYKGKNYDFIVVKGKTIRVHELVGVAFPDICGVKEKGKSLHHKNHNPKDNRAENLIYLTQSEHKRIHQLEGGVSVGVVAYDNDGNFVGEWESKQQASEATGIDYRHITSVILKKDGRFTAGGYYWFKKGITHDEALAAIVDINKKKKDSVNTKTWHKKNL